MVLINHSTRGEGVRSQGERRRRLIGRGEQPSDDESVTDGRSSISSPSIFFLFFFCFTPVSVRPSWYHVSSSVFCFIISEPIIRKKRVPFSLLNRTESQGGASHACCLVKSCTWFFVIGRNLFFLDRSSISIRVSVLYHLDIVSLPPSARRPQLGGPRRFLFLFFPPARAQQRDCIHFKFDLNLWDFSMNTFQLESKLDSPSFLFTGTNRNVEFETIDGIKLIEAL